MKTAELTGPLLDCWVAKAEGMAVTETDDGPVAFIGQGRIFQPSTNWAHGGPIIDRDDIHLGGYETSRYAEIRGDRGPWIQMYGETSLIAAMRAKVASVYGDEVPDLTNSA